MPLSQIGQIAIPVSNTDHSEAFYETTLGLRKLYRYGDLAFFDCAGIRLMLSPPENGAKVEPGQGALYFRIADIAIGVADVTARGGMFISPPHRIAEMPDHDLWMADLRDPDGHLVVLMMEAPKGYAPPG